MEFDQLIQILFLLGLPLVWPFLLALYISKKIFVVFKPKRFLLYSLLGYSILILFFALAFAFNSWLVSSGYTCNEPNAANSKLLCSKPFLGFSNWYQSYLIYLPLWVSLVTTTFLFRCHAARTSI
jgi:hypothetical protein